MGKIYRDVMVSIPDEAVVSYTDKRVYITTKKNYLPDKGFNEDSRMIIGQYVDAGHMHPNDNYKLKYPSQWTDITKQPTLAGNKKLGLFAAVHKIVEHDGIYDDLNSVFGEHKTNAILDYAMFMIGAHTNATEQYETFSKDRVLFSHSARSDNWYSDFFSEDIAAADAMKFKNAWALRCKEKGIESAYLCIDGSNNDCESKQVEIAEKGAAKSHKNVDIVSYMYAVSEKDGTPITFSEYRGGEVDSNGIKEIVTFLTAFGISIKGAIIDKGFCTKGVTDYLEENGIEYVLMLVHGTSGKTEMMKKYASLLRWRVDKYVRGTDYFGVTDTFPIFKKSDHDSYIHLYFDWRNGGERAISLIGKVYDAYDEAETAVEAGKVPKIPSKYDEYLKAVKQRGRGKRYRIEMDYEKLQTSVDMKGFSAIATSENMSAEEANKKYSKRMNSEVCYKFIKTHLGSDVTRAHKDTGVKSKLFECFLASIIRNEILMASEQVQISTNVALRELSLLEMRLLPGDIYTFIHTENERQKDLLSALGMSTKDLDQIVSNENAYNAGKVERRRRRKPGPKKGSHRKKYDENGNEIKTKPGPKLGSHHTKLSLKKDGTPKKKPGPKPGSHHKKTVDNLAN